MNELARSSSPNLLPVAPRVGPIATRVATMADLPFLDALQKQHSKALGFFPRAQMEGYLQNQWVLVAEDAATKQPLGYCASRDRYLKRDELGVVYQLCVAAGNQRKLIGASLLKAVFERSAYGCKLYCCWCAQDLAANHFWESLGFVPIAFRAGSAGKRRVHIFWQRRIVDGDATTPWWYPSQTSNGAIRADRIVFPIPPGVHWKDVRAFEIPRDAQPALDAPAGERVARAKPKAVVAPKPRWAPMGGFRFESTEPAGPSKHRMPKAKPLRAKIDPKYFRAARELRDRWLERVNAGRAELSASCGKYDVARAIAAAPARPHALPHAA